jgi:hypothetical protein
MSTYCYFRRFAPILRCTDAAGVARVPKLGQLPQTLDAVRTRLDQSSAQLLDPTRPDLAEPTDATLLRAGFALSQSTQCQRAHAQEEARTRRCQSMSRTLVAQLVSGESLSLITHHTRRSPRAQQTLGTSTRAPPGKLLPTANRSHMPWRSFAQVKATSQVTAKAKGSSNYIFSHIISVSASYCLCSAVSKLKRHRRSLLL